PRWAYSTVPLPGISPRAIRSTSLASPPTLTRRRNETAVPANDDQEVLVNPGNRRLGRRRGEARLDIPTAAKVRQQSTAAHPANPVPPRPPARCPTCLLFSGYINAGNQSVLSRTAPSAATYAGPARSREPEPDLAPQVLAVSSGGMVEGFDLWWC